MKTVLWSMSIACLAFGVLIVLWPSVVAKLNDSLNRDVVTLDRLLMRLRHVIGLLLLVSSYLFFVLSMGQV